MVHTQQDKKGPIYLLEKTLVAHIFVKSDCMIIILIYYII